MVQKHGKWGRLCIQNFDKVVARSHSSLQINDLGRAVCRSMTYKYASYHQQANIIVFS